MTSLDTCDDCSEDPCICGLPSGASEDSPTLTAHVVRMGSVWAAGIPELGISALGATEADALQGVVDALRTREG